MYNVVNKYNKYTRYNNEPSIKLKEKIKELYDSNSNVIIANSGIHATSIILETLKIYYNYKINIIFSKQCYFENINIINYFTKINNIISHEYDFINNNDSKLKELLIELSINNNHTILFIESCSNPFGYIFNYDIINELKIICPNLIIICDNTWLSNIIFNPLIVNIDIVIISLTKYYTGGIGICGACIIKNNNIYNSAEEYVKLYGIHNSPLHIKYINNGLNNYNNRINKLSLLTRYIIDYLISNNIEIIHPYIKNHISHNLAIKYFNMNIYPSTFLIATKLNEKELINILNMLTIISVSVSFGSNITKIDKNIFSNNNINYLRLSIGYDETNSSLKTKINELLNYLDQCIF